MSFGRIGGTLFMEDYELLTQQKTLKQICSEVSVVTFLGDPALKVALFRPQQSSCCYTKCPVPSGPSKCGGKPRRRGIEWCADAPRR